RRGVFRGPSALSRALASARPKRDTRRADGRAERRSSQHRISHRALDRRAAPATGLRPSGEGPGYRSTANEPARRAAAVLGKARNRLRGAITPAVLVDLLLDPDVFADPDRLRKAAARKAKLSPAAVVEVVVRRRSIDARR